MSRERLTVNVRRLANPTLRRWFSSAIVSTYL